MGIQWQGVYRKKPILQGTPARFFVIKLQDEKTKATAVNMLDLEVQRMFDVASHETLIMKFIQIH